MLNPGAGSRARADPGPKISQFPMNCVIPVNVPEDDDDEDEPATSPVDESASAALELSDSEAPDGDSPELAPLAELSSPVEVVGASPLLAVSGPDWPLLLSDE
jgi:hypothetical protein